MSTITKERLEPVIERLEHYATNVKWTNVQAAQDMLIAVDAMRIALASLEAEPVAYVMADDLKDSSIISTPAYRDLGEAMERTVGDVVALFTAPPAPVSVPEWTNEQCLEFLSIAFRHAEIKGDLELDDIRLGVKMVNGSRAAMLQGVEPVTTAYKLPAEAVYGYFAFNDHHGEEFFKKREDAIAFCKEAIEEYRQENAEEGCDPDEVRRTCWGIIMQEGTDFEVDNEGHIDYALTPELAGDSPVIPDEVLSVVRKVARIRSDFNDFDGDRRGIGDCLDEAEQELIVAINKHASAIAAAPQQEAKP